MTAKEKAKKLVQKYFDLTDHMSWEQAKECALICTNELLLTAQEKFHEASGIIKHWQEMETEIGNL